MQQPASPSGDTRSLDKAPSAEQLWEDFKAKLVEHGHSVKDMHKIREESAELFLAVMAQLGFENALDQASLLRQLDLHPKHPTDLTGMTPAWQHVIKKGNMSAEDVYERLYADYSTWGIVSALVTSFLVPLLFQSLDFNDEDRRISFKVCIIFSAYCSIFALLTELTMLTTLAATSKHNIFKFLQLFGNVYVWHGWATYLALGGLIIGYAILAWDQDDLIIGLVAAIMAAALVLAVLVMRGRIIGTYEKTNFPIAQAD